METEQRTRGLVDRPMVGRSRRRLLVAAVYLAYVALAVGWAIGEASVPSWWDWRSLSYLVFFAGAFVGTRVLRRSSRKTAELADERADERQRAVRDRAHRVAYRMVLGFPR